MARQGKVPLIVDNTLATPYLVRPFEHGADVIVHSATKFLGGHGNSIGGLIVDGGTFDWLETDRFPVISAPCPSYGSMVLGQTFGNFAFAAACPRSGPSRSRTRLVALQRVPHPDRHRDLAASHAASLRECLCRRRPSRAPPCRPLGALCRAAERSRLCDGAAATRHEARGGVLTFGVAGGYEAGVRLIEKLKLFSHLANVGDSRSLVIHPASTTHRQIEDDVGAAAGPDVVRLSVGLEDKDDLIADLDQALAV